MKGHKRTDGSVHPSAAEKYEQVKAAYEKRKEEGTSRSNDFGSVGLVEVFGSDKGKRTLRGFSSSVSKKRVKQAFLTAAVYESTNKCNSPVIGLKKVMAEKNSINGPTTEGPTLDDTYSPNLDFNPVDHPSFTRNMHNASDSQSFDTFRYDELSNHDDLQIIM
ncbi:hypothetical protein MKW94_011412 [Papaver nudicaule]|uniref:Uncharacterized protein n=1 Tax=Papaver nudicaule TaxID=74823 RepID=A0AA41VVH2_PAPNU|nr:hypothetical protein [Papaver nudicaule]